MNRELKRISIAILAMFLALFVSTTLIMVVHVDELRADGRNVRTLYDSYSAERGPILVAGEAIAFSAPSDDEYRFLREYTDPELYAAITGYFTLNQGNTGIEGAMNAHLSGTANDQFLAKINSILTGQNPKGAAVELTIDPAVQQAAWEAMGNHTGAVIALDPKTGAILALVSKPSFDPNRLASHSTSSVLEAYDELTHRADRPLINRAIAGDLYHPGSVFKVLVAAAALDSGLFTPESTFPNPARLQLPLSTATISNSGGGTCGPDETVTLATAMRLSCNIPFAEIAQQLGRDVLLDYAERFGFGQELTVPMAVTPSIYPSSLDEPQLMLSGFGQSDVRTTPLQIAMNSAAVANGGVIMRPTLVRSIVAPDLSVIQEQVIEPFATPISRETAATLTELMVQNVTNGVASNGRISGVDVAGKTGTAQNGEGQPYTLWFTGFAPADDPQVVVAVVVENGTTSGNQVAAPIARSVIEAVLRR